MIKSLIFATGAFATAAFAATTHKTAPSKFDPPDLNYEYQLHRSYLRTHGGEPASGKGLIESYELQSGDKLWSLSQMLYGDGNYWPKVWAQNKAITNPHLIRPGHTLHFQMGSEDDTPSFRFSEAEEPGVELAAMNGGGGPQIEIPPPETPPRPLIRLPKSFPEWQSVYRLRKDNFTIDDSKLLYKRVYPPARQPLSAYVQENEIESAGAFLEVEKESGLPVANQHVYVKLKKGQGQIGQKYTIVKDLGKIRKLNDQLEGDLVARFIQVYGDLELTDTAPANFRRSSDRENYEVFRALLLHANHLTMKDYALIPGEVAVVDMSKAGPEGSVNAQIIGSSKMATSALYGIGDIVFLNKGAKDGVSEGQILDIYIDRTIREERTPIPFATVSSGKLKVVKVTSSLATAVILEALDSIQQGDRAQPKMGYSTTPAPSEAQAPPSSIEPLDSFDMPPDDGDEPPADFDLE